MSDEGSTLVEVDFKGALVEAVTEKGVKIGSNWFPKSHCKALANIKKDHSVGIVALPEWIVVQKGLHAVVAEQAKKKLDKLVKGIEKGSLPPEEQILRIRCPLCTGMISIHFGSVGGMEVSK